MQKLDYKQFESLQVGSLVHSIYLQCLEATTMLFQAKEGFYFHSNTFFLQLIQSVVVSTCAIGQNPHIIIYSPHRELGFKLSV